MPPNRSLANQQRRGIVLPFLVIVLVLVTMTSLSHSRDVLSSAEDHTIEKALLEFKQGIFPWEGALTPHKGEDDDDVPFSKEERVLPIPNPTPANGQESFSACLLVMDDNHRLVEWLGYHYYVLPLRYLIITVDPRSRTSPTAILNRWRKMGMYVDEWDDFRFWKPEIANASIPEDARLQIKRDRHRGRQKVFYKACLAELRRQNRTYTTLIDTDEFLVYNHAGGSDYEEYERQQQEKHDAAGTRAKVKQPRIKPIHTPPTTRDQGAMIDYIHKEKEGGHPFYKTPCLAIPRLQFGAMESDKQDLERYTPDFLEADRFDTQRWRKHALRDDHVKNGLTKVVVDVSGVDIDKTPRFRSLHRPIPTICGQPWQYDREVGLRINHYLGSWESYSFRDDSRRGGERSREGWVFRAGEQDATDDIIRPWLDGFVEEHGEEKTKELLKDSGLPKGYKNPNETAWTIMFLDEILKANKTEGNNVRVSFDNFVRQYHANKTQDIGDDDQ